MIPVNEPLLAGNERAYLAECIETGWIGSEGPFVRRFEEAFAARCGRRHGIAVANGTAALEVAVAALRIGAGDAVVLPTFTIISCAAAVARAGAVPVLVDSDPRTWNLDLEDLVRRVDEGIGRGEPLRAILVPHCYGLPAPMDAILELARRHGLAVIEDAAEMAGQTCRGRPCGSFGDVSTFSFYPNKHVTTGEGGMVLTDDDALAERCRSLRDLCFQPGARFVHEELGWNYRMSNLQAAVGVAQLEQLDGFVRRKRTMGLYYDDRLSGLGALQTPLPRNEDAENIYWVYGVVIGDDVSLTAKEAMAWLGARGVGTRPFFYPMHEQPVFRKRGWFEGERHPVAERLARRGFYIPSGLALTRTQMTEVADAVEALMEEARLGRL